MQIAGNVRKGLSAATFFLSVSIFLLLLFWQKLPPQVPFFYSRPWGEEQLAEPLNLWLLPATSTSILLFNVLIFRFLSEEKLLAAIIAWTSALFSILVFLTLLKIIFLAL